MCLIRAPHTTCQYGNESHWADVGIRDRHQVTDPCAVIAGEEKNLFTLFD